MPCILKQFIPFFLISFIQIVSVAQPDTSLRKIPDSCITYLNRTENIKSIHSQVGIVGKDQLRNGYSINLLSALQGKINGVDVKTSTSGNSVSSVFFMRGERNLTTSSQPLYVVDGIPVIGQLTSYLDIDMGNLVNDWNLDDIESVTVLKGGQAASLYGNRAGNGAILIRTKRAKDKGFHVGYNSAVLLKRIADYPDFQNKYGQGFNGQFSYSDGKGGGINDDTDMNWGPPLNGQLITQFDGSSTGWINGQAQAVRGGDTWAREQTAINGISNSIEASPWVAQPDNVKDYFQSAWTFANNLNLSWADSHGGIRISYSNVRAEFVTPNTQYARNTLGGNFTYTFFKKITLFGSFQNTDLKDKNVAEPTGGTSYDNPMQAYVWMGRQVNTKSLKQYWQVGQEGLKQYHYIGRYWDNPWFAVYENSSALSRKNSFGTYGIRFDLVRGLSLNYLGGFNTVDAHNERNTSSADINGSYQKYGSETNAQSNSRNSFYANYNFLISTKNALNSFAGIYYEKEEGHNTYKKNNGNGEILSQMKHNGYYGGISYIWNNAVSARFSLSGDIYDYNVTAKTPVFYSLSTGVEFNEFLHLPKLISTLSFQSGISSNGLNPIAGYHTLNGFMKGEKSIFSTISEYTMGLDIGVCKNRALVQANYYNSKMKNGLVEIPIFNGIGYSSMGISSSSIRNSGYELNLSLVPVQSRKLVWNSSVSYFKNKNEVLALADGLSRVTYFSKTISMGSEIGSPAGNLYGYKLDRYEGQVIHLNGYPQRGSGDQVLGNANPDYIILFNNSIVFQRFTFTMGIEYSKGGVGFSNFMNMATVCGTLSNTADRENGIVGEGVKWDVTSGSYVKNDVNISVQDYYSKTYTTLQESYIMDATYLKLREINIAYSFKIRQKLNLTYSIFGYNIFTWSKSKDYNNGNLYFANNMFYRGLNNYNLPETYELGMKIQVHI